MPRDEKRGRKIGRNERKPSTAKRKSERPDLVRKAWNVLSHGGDLDAWVAERTKYDSPSAVRAAASEAEARKRRQSSP